MSGGWVEVSPEVAERHPLHGVRGWLRVLGILIALGVLVTVITPAVLWNGLDEWTPPLPGWVAPVHRAGLLLGIVSPIALLILFLRRDRRFRLLYVPLAVLGLVAVNLDAILVAGFRDGFDPLTAEEVSDWLGGITVVVAVSLAMEVLTIVYLLRSRRFRVTFERRVRSDDPLLAPGHG